MLQYGTRANGDDIFLQAQYKLQHFALCVNQNRFFTFPCQKIWYPEALDRPQENRQLYGCNIASTQKHADVLLRPEILLGYGRLCQNETRHHISLFFDECNFVAQPRHGECRHGVIGHIAHERKPSGNGGLCPRSKILFLRCSGSRKCTWISMNPGYFFSDIVYSLFT